MECARPQSTRHEDLGDGQEQEEQVDPPNGPDFHLLCACEKRWQWRQAVCYREIQRCANSCRLCNLFRIAIEAIVDGSLPTVFRAPRTEAQRHQILRRVTTWDCYRPRIATREADLSLNLGGDPIVIKMLLDAEKDDHFVANGRLIEKEFLLGPRTNSERGLCRASNWLAECLVSHSCGNEQDTASPPTRLLFVGQDSPGPQEDIVRLLKTRGTEIKYACLSYRWGGNDQRRLLTTTRTLQQHARGIPFAMLPRTFQDAVTITRSMKLEYLWIDALCILQSFDEMTEAEEKTTAGDWEWESSQMANIFQRCNFTISADISTSMDSGIFSQVPIEHHRLEAVDDDGKTASVYIRRHMSHHTSPTQLETRGWTFQEYLLSPRTLHFGDFDIVWRCKEKHTCECGHITGAAGWRELLASLSKPVPDDANRIVEYWETVVFNYSPRILANKDDKLPALSGVAQRFHQKTGWTYLAGLWKENLLHDLSWYITRPQTSPFDSGLEIGMRPEQFRAPSWSWASVDNRNAAHCCVWARGKNHLHPVSPSSEPSPICTVRDVFCQPKGNDPFGRVSDGYIDLCGVLISATVEDISATVDKEFGSYCPWKLTNVDDDTFFDLCRPDCELADVGLTSGDAVYCVPIQESLTEVQSQRGCLILKQRESHAPDEYERVGFCVLTKNNPDLVPEESIPRRHTRRWERRDLPEGEYAEMVKGHKFQLNPDIQTCIRIF